MNPAFASGQGLRCPPLPGPPQIDHPGVLVEVIWPGTDTVEVETVLVPMLMLEPVDPPIPAMLPEAD